MQIIESRCRALVVLIAMVFFAPHISAEPLEEFVAKGDEEFKELVSKIRKPARIKAVRLSEEGLKVIASPNSKLSKNLMELEIYATHAFKDAHFENFAKLDKLKGLKITGCSRIDGSGLVHLEGLESLESLDLSGARRISENSLESIYKLTGLKSLTINQCPQLVFNQANFAKLKALESLELEGTGIRDQSLNIVGKLTTLKSISFAGCKELTSEGLKSLSGLEVLTTLNLKFCPGLENAELAEILAPLKELATLRLGKLVEDSSLVGMEDMPNLNDLDVEIECRGSNWLKWRVAKSKRMYGSDIDLTGHYQIKDDGLSSLSGFTRLRTLILEDCHQITDRGVARLKSLPALRKLSLSKCIRFRFSDLVRDHVLEHMKGLEELDLSYCERIRPDMLENIAKITTLKRLDLTGCEYLSKEDIVALRKKMPECQITSDARPASEMEGMGRANEDDGEEE